MISLHYDDYAMTSLMHYDVTVPCVIISLPYGTIITLCYVLHYANIIKLQ